MKRLLVMAATVAFLLGLGAPAVLAGEPFPDTGRVLVSVNGPVDIPAGEHLDTLVVVGGDARISGDVRTIVIARGTATLSGATTETLVVVNGSADLQAGTTVLGDVRTLDGVVTQQPGATVQGTVKTLDADLAALGLLLIPAFILLFLGLGLAMVGAGLLVAAFWARQVRAAGSLIRREPGPVLVAGIAGMVALPLLAILLIATVIGAPMGFGILFVLLPAAAFLAWIVAAIWIGDWIVVRTRGAAEADHPYLASVRRGHRPGPGGHDPVRDRDRHPVRLRGAAPGGVADPPARDAAARRGGSGAADAQRDLSGAARSGSPPTFERTAGPRSRRRFTPLRATPGRSSNRHRPA